VTTPTSSEDWITSAALDHLVASVAIRLGLHLDDVPDLVQETRIALWELGLDSPASRALVSQIAKNKSIDLLRRRVRRRARDLAASGVVLTREENAELQHLVNVQVEGLSKRLRVFHELHYHEGRSEREIARITGVSRSSVRWLDRTFLRSLISRRICR
jgi:RNA polymerase sigma factor (sigma-70 family)